MWSILLNEYSKIIWSSDDRHSGCFQFFDTINNGVLLPIFWLIYTRFPLGWITRIVGHRICISSPLLDILLWRAVWQQEWLISYILSSTWCLRQFYFWQPDGLRMLGHCFHLPFLFYVAIKKCLKSMPSLH